VHPHEPPPAAAARTLEQASQKREPKRYRGLYGAAAAQAGDRDKARQYSGRLIEVAGSGDMRSETERARRYLGGN
jgi:hypothetical protein